MERVLESGFIDWTSLHGELYDYRSLVLHWAQRKRKNVEYLYEAVSQKPSLFECRLVVDGEEKIRARGRNKKMAGQAVSRIWIETLGEVE